MESETAKLIDITSGLYYLTYSLGTFIGPVIGNYLNEKYDVRTTCDIFLLVCLGYLIIYSVC